MQIFLDIGLDNDVSDEISKTHETKPKTDKLD